ncbi:GbsR/MarR family transcriptional regulator [Arcticibacterium luteifluviistationis]|uniref:HTH-type transcriptional regulator n=1 Tax=Arcticibacterium luteifluviistationis TaxID=1784714 RepID=A0A2Z4G963_9BACT|nr:ArsR family transcriptional regulator [Arcticibacterium luteifluviistationis]AWV97779.1 transcriptional regulator [Arcticibacterium luteifluviistationis]
MELQEAKDKFIHTWGTLATQWGINRTMSQIHALLLLSPKSLNADQIMEELKISRGNVNMNLRDLMSWGLINKQLLPGERKEYFLAEKDIWKVARQIAKERKRREVEPIIETMDEIKSQLKPDTDEKKEVLKIIDDINQVTNFTNNTVQSVLKAEESWLINNFLKLFKQ